MLVLEVYGLAAEFVALGRVDNMDTAVRLALVELPGLADYVDEWGLEPPLGEPLPDCEECDNTGLVPCVSGCGDACGGWANYCQECDRGKQ